MEELLKIESFKNNINNCINNSQLSIGIIKYILKDMLNEIDILYNNLLQQELNKQQDQQIPNPFKGFENKSIVAFEEQDIDDDENDDDEGQEQ